MSILIIKTFKVESQKVANAETFATKNFIPNSSKRAYDFCEIAAGTLCVYKKIGESKVKQHG